MTRKLNIPQLFFQTGPVRALSITKCIRAAAEELARPLLLLLANTGRVYRVMRPNEPPYWILYEGYRGGVKFSASALEVLNTYHLGYISRNRLLLEVNPERGVPEPIDYYSAALEMDPQSLLQGAEIRDPVSGDAIYPSEFEIAFRREVMCPSQININFQKALYCAGYFCESILAIYVGHERDPLALRSTDALAAFRSIQPERALPQEDQLPGLAAIGVIVGLEDANSTLAKYIAAYAASIVNHHNYGGYHPATSKEPAVTERDVYYFLSAKPSSYAIEGACSFYQVADPSFCAYELYMVADEIMQRVKNVYRDCAGTETTATVTELRHMSSYESYSWRPSDPRAARLWDALLAHGFSPREIPRILKQVYYSPDPAQALAEQLVRHGYTLLQARELARQLLAEVSRVG